MKKSGMKKAAAGMLAAVCVAALFTGCGSPDAATEEEQGLLVPVTVQAPEAGTLSLKNEFVGTVSPQEAVYVVPMVSAEVLSTNVSVGDTVMAGDILCQLDSEAAQLQMESAQVQYSSAQAGLNSAQAGVASAQAGLNSAQVGYNGALASYASAEAQADAQLGGQKKLQDYQTQVGIDKIKDNLEDLEEDLDDARDDRDKAKKDYKEAEKTLAEAQKLYDAAKAKEMEAKENLNSLSTASVSRQVKSSDDVSGNDSDMATYTSDTAAIDAAGDAVDKASKEVDDAKKLLDAAQANYTYRKEIYEGKKQIKDSYQDAYDDLEESLEQAETIQQITEEDVYGDVRRIVDTTKGAAMSGVDAAEAGIATAQAGVASAQAGVNSAQVGVAAAQVGIDSAQYQLDMYTITAPISGVIEAVSVEEHGFASPGSPAFVISNKSTMTVTFYASAGIRNTFRIGEKVQIERDGAVYDAAITEIGSMVDQATGLFKIKASVTAPDDTLLSGTNVKVIANTYEQNDTLMIPYDAVYYADSQAYVYVAESGKAVRKNIETGIFDETTITVLSGLTGSDQVIVSWSSNLRDGADISVQTKEASSSTETEGAQ